MYMTSFRKTLNLSQYLILCPESYYFPFQFAQVYFIGICKRCSIII